MSLITEISVDRTTAGLARITYWTDAVRGEQFDVTMRGGRDVWRCAYRAVRTLRRHGTCNIIGRNGVAHVDLAIHCGLELTQHGGDA